MDFGFGTMVRKIVTYFLLACALSSLLAGCDYTTYPYSSNVRWASMDPDFTLEYRIPTRELPYRTTEYLIFNEEQVFVEIVYFPSAFVVVPPDSTDFETVYLRGRWKMFKNELVFYIEEDNLFDGIYEEIHFAREDLE